MLGKSVSSKITLMGMIASLRVHVLLVATSIRFGPRFKIAENCWNAREQEHISIFR